MTAIRAEFDGTRVILPPDAPGRPAGSVIVIFEEREDLNRFPDASQEAAFAKVWDNSDDAIYDQL